MPCIMDRLYRVSWPHRVVLWHHRLVHRWWGWRWWWQWRFIVADL